MLVTWLGVNTDTRPLSGHTAASREFSFAHLSSRAERSREPAVHPEINAWGMGGACTLPLSLSLLKGFTKLSLLQCTERVTRRQGAALAQASASALSRLAGAVRWADGAAGCRIAEPLLSHMQLVTEIVVPTVCALCVLIAAVLLLLLLGGRS